ncbi:MAG: hypothetical protein V3V96_14300 [Acidiferrobacterales bacterium]
MATEPEQPELNSNAAFERWWEHCNTMIPPDFPCTKDAVKLGFVGGFGAGLDVGYQWVQELKQREPQR